MNKKEFKLYYNNLPFIVHENDYYELAKGIKHISFDCDFDEYGNCKKAPHEYPFWKTCCCDGCVKHKGYIRGRGKIKGEI